MRAFISSVSVVIVVKVVIEVRVNSKRSAYLSEKIRVKSRRKAQFKNGKIKSEKSKRLTEVKSEERRAGTKARWASVEKGQLKSKNLNGAYC